MTSHPSGEQTIATPTVQDEAPRPPRTPAVAIGLSVIALVLCVLLVLPYLAHRHRSLLLLLALAALAGVAGIALGLRARRSAARGGWSMICALAALSITGVMAAVFITGMISATAINSVELRGQGPQGVSATISNDMEESTVTWTSEGWAKFNTKGSWAQLELEVPEDSASKTVSCQIIWNDKIVVEETSDSGSVTCRYDEG